MCRDYLCVYEFFVVFDCFCGSVVRVSVHVNCVVIVVFEYGLFFMSEVCGL